VKREQPGIRTRSSTSRVGAVTDGTAYPAAYLMQREVPTDRKGATRISDASHRTLPHVDRISAEIVRVPTFAAERSHKIPPATVRPMHLIDTASIPGADNELALYNRGKDYFIKILGGQDLMNTRAHASEDALGEIASAGLRQKRQARVLIGGLGMGFTLSAALRQLSVDAEVVVAEIVPGVIDWNRGVLAEYAGRPLDDLRTRVQAVDVVTLLRTEHVGFDAIVLDVDNGPEALTRASNQWLYSREGLSVILQVLRPGGALAVWSAGPDKTFTRRLRAAGFVVEEVSVRAHAGKGARHVVWLARSSSL